MNLHLTAASIALAFASSAFAATATTGGIDPINVTDTTNNGIYVAGTAGSSNFTANKYNGSQVLVGASFSALLANESVSFTRGFTGSGNPTGTAYGYGSLSIAGITANANSTAINSGAVGSSGTSGTIAAYTVAGTATTQAQLDALYGAGTVTGSVNEALYISKTDGGTRSINVNNNSNRTATVTYDYSTLNHANGSFTSSGDTDVLSLSFVDILAGATSSQNFNLYNVLGSYGLNVVSIVANPGNSGIFSVAGPSASNLAADGSFAAGTVNMAAAAVGAYSGSWIITVADSASGIGAGKNLTNTDTLTLNVSANVIPVPEPEAYAMFLAGLGLMGFVAGRRHKRS